MLAILIALAAAPAVLLLLWRQWSSKMQLTYHGFGAIPQPPAVPGLPLLGNAVALGKGGARFVQQCHKEYGDCFTLTLLGQRMTFIFGEPAIERYFTAPDSEITFGPAVQQFTHRIFGLPPKHFFNKHSIMLGALRDELAPAGLQRYARELLALAQEELGNWPDEGEVELYGAMQSLVFKASVSTLFGRSFLEAHGAKPLQDAFFQFEAGFELAASPVPHLLQPRFVRARAALLAALRASFKAGHFEGSVAEAMAAACELPPQFVPNMLLALLWASQANSVPAAFWSLGFLLLPENQPIQQELRCQLGADLAGQLSADMAGQLSADLAGQAAGSREGGRGEKREGGGGEKRGGSSGRGGGGGGEEAGDGEVAAAVLRAALDRGSLAVRCVVEAVRLRAMAIDVRIAAADVALPSGKEGRQVLISKGSVVALCPYASHQDPRLFGSDASAFDPDRPGMLFGGSTQPHRAVVGVGGLAGLSFGGGKYRCPGRFFAEAEISLLLCVLLTNFDFQLKSAAQLDAAGVPGSGSLSGGSGKPQGGEGANRRSAFVAGSRAGVPGDPAGLLPLPDHKRLVGLRVPAGPCWVRFVRRQQLKPAA